MKLGTKTRRQTRKGGRRANASANGSPSNLPIEKHDLGEMELVIDKTNKTGINPEIHYKMFSTIPVKFLNKIRNNHPYSAKNVKNELSTRRMFSDSIVKMPGSKSVSEHVSELSPAFSGMTVENTAVIDSLFNKTTNILNSKTNGVTIGKNKVLSIFTNNVEKEGLLTLAKPNPQTQSHFLRKGIGSILLEKIIEDLHTKRGIQFIILVPLTQGLINYYERYGFVTVDNIKPYIFRGSNVFKDIIYGNKGLGGYGIMVKKL